MNLSAAGTTWPQAVLWIGILFAVIFAFGAAMATIVEFRKNKQNTQQQEEIARLVGRYEQLAASTLDAQQRTAADVAELRARAAAIEQILRTVE